MATLQQALHKFYVRRSRLSRTDKLVSFYEKNVDRDRRRLLIACMPKSGSTFMTTLLRAHLGFPVHESVRDYGRSEQEISWSKLARTIDSDALFVQQHVRASANTLKAIRLFNIKTLVLIRNLFDIVASIRDHLLKESLESPLAYVDASFLKWETRRQYEFIIDMFLPWYLNFMGTWIEADKDKSISLLWLNYADWIYQPEATLAKVDAFCGVTHSEEDAVKSVALARKGITRLNVGRAGRGRELLDDALQAKVHHLLDYYPACAPYRAQLV